MNHKTISQQACLFIFTTIAITLSAQAKTAVYKEPEAIPGEYVVKLSENVSLKATGTEDLQEVLGSYIKSRLEEQNIVVIKRPVFETQKSVVNQLKENPYVEIVEPNYIYRASAVEANDPLLPKLWGMKNTGQKDPSGQEGVAGIDISAPEAWNIQTGSKDLVVAVIDTGINYNAEDLSENTWTNEAELNGKPGVDDDNNGYIDDVHGFNFVTGKGDPLDDHGHGSHCSGTIGAKGNDGKGIVGVAWNVKLMGVKFLSKEGSGSLEGAIKAIDYATKNGAKIMNNSWGGGAYSETLKQAIERSHKAGVLFIAAAGNETNNNDSNPAYPASYNVPNVLSVAAIDNKGKMATFSNYGKTKVHVAAPGVNIYSTTARGYDSWSGTSMATPHVTGIAALLASEFPQMKNTEMKKRIIDTAKPQLQLRGKVSSRGIANAYSALTNTLPAPDANDPVNWASKTVSVSTPHPYTENFTETYEVKVDGAKEIALYFEKLNTEAKYDTVTIVDSTGRQTEILSGPNNEAVSSVISGNTVKIIFKSDSTNNGYGFDITKVYYR